MRLLITLPILLLLIGCEADKAKAVAAYSRSAFFVFLVITAGIFIVSPFCTKAIRRLNIPSYILLHAGKIAKRLFFIGISLLGVALIHFVSFEQGREEATALMLTILALSILISACCIKKYQETTAEEWLKRCVQTLYASVLCMLVIHLLIGQVYG